MAADEPGPGTPVEAPSAGAGQSHTAGWRHRRQNGHPDTLNGGAVPPDLPLLPRTVLHHPHGLDRLSGSAVAAPAGKAHSGPPGRNGSRPSLPLPLLARLSPAARHAAVDVHAICLPDAGASAETDRADNYGRPVCFRQANRTPTLCHGSRSDPPNQAEEANMAIIFFCMFWVTTSRSCPFFSRCPSSLPASTAAAMILGCLATSGTMSGVILRPWP